MPTLLLEIWCCRRMGLALLLLRLPRAISNYPRKLGSTYAYIRLPTKWRFLWDLLPGLGICFWEDLPLTLHHNSLLLAGFIELFVAEEQADVGDNAVPGNYIIRAVKCIRSNQDQQANNRRISPKIPPSDFSTTTYPILRA